MSWYHSEGNCPATVLFSSVTYRRNLAKLPFRGKETAEAEARIEAILIQNGFHKEALSAAQSPLSISLAEKHFFDSDLLLSDSDRALYLNEPCSLAIAVGGTDLLSIRSLLPGRAVSEGLKIAAGAEELLDRSLELAYSKEYGYLTANPVDAGSGCRFSALLYLPSQRDCRNREAISRILLSANATLVPLILAKDNPGDLYFLEQKLPHRIDEESAATAFDRLLEILITTEGSSRRALFSAQSIALRDKAWRAYGILSYATHLDEPELQGLLSELRLALSTVENKADLPPLSFAELAFLTADFSDASLLQNNPQAPCRSREDCCTLRADSIRTYLFNKTGDKNGK